MEGGYDVSSTVENPNLNNPEPPYPQEIPNSEQIYQQQEQPQHEMQNHLGAERPMEIPAAKVHK